VFISHSSANKEIVEQLSSYIEKLGVSSEHIFCSSVISQGIDNGDKLGKAISEAIGKSRVLVFLLSRDFVSSVYCMQELGVGWHLSEKGKAKCFCLVLPDISISEIRGFINSNVVKFTFIDETHKDELSLFAENLCKALHITPPKHSVQANNESVFYSAIKEKLSALLLKRNLAIALESEKEETIEKQKREIEEKDREIEALKAANIISSKQLLKEMRTVEKRTMEKDFAALGYTNGISKKLFNEVFKDFWYDIIERYEDIMKYLELSPENEDMEMLFATIYAADNKEKPAYEHMKAYIRLNNLQLADYQFDNFFQGYHGTMREVIDMLKEKAAKEREGSTKDSYLDTIQFLEEREKQLGFTD
jgi:hypothetical protein